MKQNAFENVNRSIDFYSYVLDFSALAAAGSTGQSFSIDTDSDFMLQKLCQTTDIAGAVITNATFPVPLVTIQITDGGSSRHLFSRPAAMGSLFGFGAEPFILPAPRVFSAGSTVTVSLVNYSAATAYNIRLAFIGLKKYRFASVQ